MRSQCLRVAMALRMVRLMRRRVISGRAMATSVTVVVGLGNGIHIHKFASTAATCMCTDKKDCLRKMPTCQQYACNCCLDCLRKKCTRPRRCKQKRGNSTWRAGRWKPSPPAEQAELQVQVAQSPEAPKRYSPRRSSQNLGRNIRKQIENSENNSRKLETVQEAPGHAGCNVFLVQSEVHPPRRRDGPLVDGLLRQIGFVCHVPSGADPRLYSVCVCVQLCLAKSPGICD